MRTTIISVLQSVHSSRRLVFEGQQRGVFHPASHEIFHNSRNAARCGTEKIIVQVHEMNRVGESDPAVVARSFEATEVAAQNPKLTELAVLNGFMQPLRRGVEAKNVAHLENPFLFFGQLSELFGFGGNERNRIFDEYILAGFEKFVAQSEVRLSRSDDHGGIDAAGKIAVVRCEMV